MANGCILAVTISTGRTSARRAGLVNSKTAQHLFKGLLREALLLLLLSIGLPLLQLFLHPAEEGFEFVFRPTKLLQKSRIDLTTFLDVLLNTFDGQSRSASCLLDFCI